MTTSNNRRSCKVHRAAPVRDGIIKNMPNAPIEEVPMSDATLKAKEIKKALHSDDPILSKETHIYGLVEIFPPNAGIEQWPILSFLVKSEHGDDGEESRGLNTHIKAKYVHSVFERPHFINDYMKFGFPDA